MRRDTSVLAKRVRTWTIREAARRGAGARFHKNNMPGGWGELDAHGQRRGLVLAALVSPKAAEILEDGIRHMPRRNGQRAT